MAEDTQTPKEQSTSYLTFPYPNSKTRLDDYAYFEKLFLGDHFAAFNIRIDDKEYTKAYQMLRYVKANFAGLISKIMADMLFSEPVNIKVPDGDQDWVDAFVYENKLDVLFYETALLNSYEGDALWKLRIGKRHDYDTESTVIVESAPPNIYFPTINEFNVQAEPKEKELAWTFEDNKKKYLRKEIHTSGLITTKVYELTGDKITTDVTAEYCLKWGIPPVEETKIKESTLIHIVNWKPANRHFGLSDYYDLDSIFYAINNRLTKVDNILDKHSDPILAVPEGVLDEKGKVRRENLQMVEIPDGVTGSKSIPQYVVWNASLENAFKQIENLTEIFYMISETSPDILGMGNGQSDSGRALKLKLLRTIAKAQRKKLYFNYAIKDIIYRAQLLSKAWGVKVGKGVYQGEPVVPELEWADGIPIDTSEQVDTEVKRVDAGLTTKVDAIMRIDGVDEDTAEDKVKDIDKEGKIDMPTPKIGGLFGKGNFNEEPNNPLDKEGKDAISKAGRN